MVKKFWCAGSSRVSGWFGVLTGVTLLLAVLCFLFHTGELYAGGFALSGVGSKAIGMGGAFRGLADDWSAAYWNPAGLTQLEESQLTGMLVFLSPRPEYTPDISYGGIDVGYRNDRLTYTKTETIVIPDFGGFLKLDAFEDYTFGVAVFIPAGLYSEWDLYNPTPAMDIRNQYPRFDHIGKLTVLDIHPSLARSFMEEKLSLGAGISIIWGDIIYQKAYLTPSGIPIPHENLLIDTRLEGDGWGFGANFGALYKFSENFQMGISGKLPVTLNLEGTAAQELYTLNNEYLRDMLLGNAFTRAESLQIFSLFALENMTAEPNAKADLKLPGDIGVGVAIKANEKLTFTGEVAVTFWSALDSVVIELDGFDPSGSPAENSTIMFLWDDITRVSLGAEYKIADPLALRFGYYFDPSPIPDSTFSPIIPDLGDKNSFNIGAALTLGGVEISYNYEYLMFEDRNIATLSDVNGDGTYDNYPGLYKTDLHASHLLITYRF
ncbi:MAG: outer membrane protein transport protein [Candidatus Zixiibacteriota bacterium]|nr:MAG: outer membrane protein transport protein [candidate division Zixibacteria bacterium]